MNRDNPITPREALEYLRALAAIMGMKSADARIEQLAQQCFSQEKRFKWAGECRRNEITPSIKVRYVIELHRSGNLPVPRELGT